VRSVKGLQEGKLALMLESIQVKEPFQQWGLDFIGVINPNSSIGHKFILTTTY